MKWVLIAVGGGFGSVLRYAVQGGMQRLVGASFPIGTLVVNLIGCLAIGFLAGMFRIVPVREEYRIGLMTGLLGGFTTFSAFGLETFAAFSDSEVRNAALNIVVSCVGGLAAVWIGYRMAQYIYGAA